MTKTNQLTLLGEVIALIVIQRTGGTYSSHCLRFKGSFEVAVTLRRN
jgi:hypothetical protein